jgi:hypothetical protein
MSRRQWTEVSDTSKAAHPVVVLLLVQDVEGGWFLRGYDRDGGQTQETWHVSLVSARQWAVSEFGPGRIGKFGEIQDSIDDPIGYALRRRR